jgi:hypothetical protein
MEEQMRGCFNMKRIVKTQKTVEVIIGIYSILIVN